MKYPSRRLRVTVRWDDLRLLEQCAARAQNDLTREASLLLAFGIRSSWQRWQQLEAPTETGHFQTRLPSTPDLLRDAADAAEAATREQWQTPTDPDEKAPTTDIGPRSVFRPRQRPKQPPA